MGFGWFIGSVSVGFGGLLVFFSGFWVFSIFFSCIFDGVLGGF